MPEIPITRVVVQSADRLRREGLAAYLETLDGIKVVGHVGRHDDAVSFYELEHVDIVLLDTGREPARAIEACRSLRVRFPDVRVLLMYDRLTTAEVAAAREAGVAALAPCSRGLGAITDRLRALAERTAPSWSGGHGLTDRQQDILMLIASGHSTVEIAELLRISPGTVENHKRRVYAKLNATNSVQAVARATVLGLIDSAPVPPSRTSPLPWREISAGDPAAETRHTMLALALGESGEALDRVVRTLIAHGLPVLHELWPQPLARAHWLGWHRGPIVTIMIDPTAEHWRAAGALGGTGVVVHSEPLDERALVEALTNTIAAVVSADHIEERLVPVLTLVAQGCVVLEQATAGPLLDRACVQFAERRAQVPTLTPREFDVLKSIGRYHTVRQTANALGIAAKTVENARVNLFRKLGVRNQTGALAAAYSLGLLKADNT